MKTLTTDTPKETIRNNSRENVHNITKKIKYLCFSEQFSLSVRSVTSFAGFLGSRGFPKFVFKISNSHAECQSETGTFNLTCMTKCTIIPNLIPAHSEHAFLA
jgi:hypothetical protein